MVLFPFIFCVQNSLENLVVVAWWSDIVLVSAYHGRLIVPSILNDSFAE
jgi:hypothetical protein